MGDYKSDEKGISKFLPPQESIETHEVYDGLILDQNIEPLKPVAVMLEGHDEETKISIYCFTCSSTELFGLEPCHSIRYHKIKTKDGNIIEIVELIKTELDLMIDEAIDQITDLRKD